MVEVSSIAPDAMEGDDLSEQKRYCILGYGNPGTAKTHFGFTMPGPVCCIDIEGKSHVIRDKFDKDIHIWQPENYSEASDALSQALDVLEKYRSEEGVIGTVMVDSMSDMWDMSQQKHMEMAHPGKDPNEVNFTSALQGSGQSDWQAIKRLHNERFRALMLESDFNVYWSCKSEEDYAAILEGSDDPPAKPVGEKNNQYKCSEMIHFYEGEEGTPHANLKKAAATKWRFGSLEWPTFPKAKGIIETISEAEKSPESIALGEIMEELDESHDTGEFDLFDGDPDVVYSGREDE